MRVTKARIIKKNQKNPHNSICSQDTDYKMMTFSGLLGKSAKEFALVVEKHHLLKELCMIKGEKEKRGGAEAHRHISVCVCVCVCTCTHFIYRAVISRHQSCGANSVKPFRNFC